MRTIGWMFAVLGMLIFLISPNQSVAEQFNGGLGLRYTTSAHTLPAGFIGFSTYSRATQLALGSKSEPYGAGGFSLNYGITRDFEFEITGILYQDKKIIGKSNNPPHDVYIRWKLGNYQTHIKDLPVTLGLQFSSRLDFGSTEDIPFEPYGGRYTSHQLNALISYYKNPVDREMGWQVHYNLGYVFFNDNISLGAIKSYLGITYPFWFRWTAIVESHGMFYTQSPLPGTSLYSVEDYLYYTPTLRYRVNPSLYLTSSLDILVYQGQNITRRPYQPSGYPDYPEWRWTLGLKFIPKLAFQPIIRKMEPATIEENGVERTLELSDLKPLEVTLPGIRIDSDPKQLTYVSTGDPVVKLDGKKLQKSEQDSLSESDYTGTGAPVSILDYRGFDLEMKLDGYKALKKRIVVTPGERYTAEFTMQPRDESRKEALWRSALIPGWGQRYNGQTTWGWIVTATQVIALGYSAYATFDYYDKRDAYDQAAERYHQAVSESAVLQAKADMAATQSDLRQAANMADISYGMTAGVYCFNLLDVAYWDGGKIKLGHRR